MRPGKLRDVLDYFNAAGYIIFMLGAACIIGPLFAIAILAANGVMPAHRREEDEVEPDGTAENPQGAPDDRGPTDN